jgi:hypothetical protein
VETQLKDETVALKSSRLKRAAAAVVAGCAAVAVTAGVATPAKAAAHPVTYCPAAPALVNPFLAWNDSSNYVLAPDGGLEAGGTAWALTGGAAVVNVNETNHVHGQADTHSLFIPAGGSATTATFCLDPSYPTMRFFVAGSGAKVSVDVLYTDASGKAGWHPLGKVNSSFAWAASPVLKLVDKAQQPTAQFRFSVDGNKGGVLVDDVYVDPFIRR